ncbi:MAG: T9SS type A sorting domain-containing protein [Bacteroidaceae bacterium]|nr:T9SS type A sorting domain-containing protein [Bacteroidaceae bacterium]
MKKIYTLLLFLVFCLPGMAQQILIEKGGNTETVEFENLDKITFNGTTVKILQTNGIETSASMGEIERIHFSNYSNIDDITVQKENIFNYISNDCIAINCNAGDIVRIYNIIGNQLMCVRQKSANSIISIANLPQGIYIIKINDQTAKFVKR